MQYNIVLKFGNQLYLLQVMDNDYERTKEAIRKAQDTEELWDFSLLEIWDGTIEANHNMRYWTIVDEFGELRIFETYDFEEFEEKE